MNALWRELRVPSDMHAGLRLIDVMLILAIGALCLFLPLGGWTPVLWIALGLAAVWVARRCIPDAEQ